MSQYHVRFFAILILLLSSLVSGAEELAPPPIGKGQTVQVINWDAKSQTYELIKNKYPAQGPNFVTMKDLVAAIKTLDAKRVKKKPKSIVGNEYELDEDVLLQPVQKILNQQQEQKKKK